MNGYKLSGIKLLNRIYKTENRRNGNLGPVYFYNNYLLFNKKNDIVLSMGLKYTDVANIYPGYQNGNEYSATVINLVIQ